MTISVIVPVLDESEQIEATLASTRDSLVAEIIVVDGGSSDDTIERASRFSDRVLRGPRGRALQMNAGADVAVGDVLLFLHADTHLPLGFGAAVQRAIEAGAISGRFDVRLAGKHPMLPVIAMLMNARSRWSGIATGDQAIFVRREVFSRVGGYPPIPLMEDVALTKSLKRMGAISALRAKVTTSARRWETYGVMRTVALMWWTRLQFFLGRDPELLVRRYSNCR